MSEILESTVNAEPEVNVEPQQGETTNEPVNAGSEEVAPSQVEEKPTQSAEENARFAQIRREAEAKARDKTIAEMNMEWNGQKITTYEQYIKAKAESEQYEREQKIREEYENKGLPDELVEELIESKRDREERKAEKQARLEQERKNAEYAEFFNYFETENGRSFDPKKDTIPEEVWIMTAEKDEHGNPNPKRKTLADAYAYHHTKQLKAKIAEYESKLKAQETNQINANSTTGSLTGNGNVGDGHISFETFEANKHDSDWVKKNFTKINESRTKW